MQNKFISLLFITIAALFIVGCASPRPKVTKGSEFPYMYEEQPRSLLILPPMNNSSDAEAKGYYMTTVEVPFAQVGYYVFPVEMVSDILKQQGINDTSELYRTPPEKFYQYFGADAVVFTTIKTWKVSYAVIASSLTVEIEAKIVSTKTARELWKYSGKVSVDLSGGNANSLEGLVVKAVLTAVTTAVADYVKYAKVANSRIIHTLPAGPYSPYYLQDQDIEIIDQTPQNH